MSVKIRLQRKGRKKKPFYHIVIADARAKRDGRLIEKIGSYNPLTVPATIQVDRDKAFEWLMKGAQPTNTVRAILRYNGVLYRKHLMRGVAKGAMTEEQAMEKYNAWVAEKDAAVVAEFAKTAEKIKAHHRMIDGKAPEKKVATIAADTSDAKPAAPKTLLESIDKTEIDTTSGEMVSASEVVEEAPVKEVKKEVVETPAPVVEEVKAEVKETPAPVVEEVKAEVKETPAPVVEEVKETPTPVVKVVKKEVEETPTPVVKVVKKEVVETPTPVVKVVKKVVETAAPAEEVKQVAKAGKQDDLKVIEGVGPKIAELLTTNGVDTWQKLSEAEPEALKEILAKGGARYTMHNPTTWPQQAQLCVDGKWDELKALQDRLDGGIDKG